MTVENCLVLSGVLGGFSCETRSLEALERVVGIPKV